MRTCCSTLNRCNTFSVYIVFDIFFLFFSLRHRRVNKEMAITTKKVVSFFPLIIRAIYYILHCALYFQAANNV